MKFHLYEGMTPLGSGRDSAVAVNMSGAVKKPSITDMSSDDAADGKGGVGRDE
jgi:hypothetical protein